MFIRKTSHIKSNELSVASLEKIDLGGLEQTILIRGENIEHPIILFLHGGPGTSQIGFAPKFQKPLEKEFVVVNWDQRGAGLSFSPNLKPEDLTIDDFVKDGIELITYLLKRFDKKKLFLVGHSWGTILGTMIAQQCPELLYSYIGIGQIANMQQGEKISYDYVMKCVRESGDKKALRKLESVEYNPRSQNYLKIQRRLLNKFGASIRNISMYQLIYSNILSINEYKFRDWLASVRGGRLSLRYLWDEILTIDFMTQVKALKVPTYIFAGQYDYQTPFELSKAFLDQLDAPYKAFIQFEHSAHAPNFEEAEKFCEEVVKIKKSNLSIETVDSYNS